MSFRFSKLTVTDWVRLYGPFLTLILLGFLVRKFYRFDWLWPDLFIALSDALFIAGLIGVVLELYSTKFLIERVAEDLTEKLVGRGLPKKLQSHIRGITKTAIVREKFQKTYTFGAPENGRILLDIEITFEARNFSDSTQWFAPEIQEESAYKPEFLRLEYGIAREKPYVFDAGELQKLLKINPETQVKSVKGSHNVKLKSNKDNDPNACQVRWRYRVTMPDEYSDVTSFAAATMGATLILRDLPQGLDFHCSGEFLVHEGGSLTWYFNRPFITDQHVRVWWSKKKDPEPQL
jgi:hypothetical protein